MQTITVKIPDDMAKFLEQLAAEEERSKSYYIRKAIARHLEDLADIRVAKQRRHEKSTPLEQVMRENGLLDD